jgi:hypothetical protein
MFTKGARRRLMLESVRTETTTSRGCESSCIFIEVVLLYPRFIKCGTFVRSPSRNEIDITENGKYFYFLFKKRIPENGPGNTHIHTFKENKQNSSHPS